MQCSAALFLHKCGHSADARKGKNNHKSFVSNLNSAQILFRHRNYLWHTSNAAQHKCFHYLKVIIQTRTGQMNRWTRIRTGSGCLQRYHSISVRRTSESWLAGFTNWLPCMHYKSIVRAQIENMQRKWPPQVHESQKFWSVSMPLSHSSHPSQAPNAQMWCGLFIKSKTQCAFPSPKQ